MSDLADFILARVAEDEAEVAEWPTEGHWGRYAPGVMYQDAQGRPIYAPRGRALRQCQAIRRIAEDFPKWPTVTFGGAQQWPVHLRLLASIWADHPDYREEWAA